MTTPKEGKVWRNLQIDLKVYNKWRGYVIGETDDMPNARFEKLLKADGLGLINLDKLLEGHD